MKRSSDETKNHGGQIAIVGAEVQMIRNAWSRGMATCVVIAALTAPPPTSAQQVFIHPDRGQSQQQQSEGQTCWNQR